MKYLFLLTAALFYFGTSQAQDIPASSVPAAVKNALMKTHPDARDIDWEKKGANYNVEYEVGRLDHELWITPTGEIIKHKEEITSSNLPQGITALIKSDYNGYRIDDTEKLTKGSQVLYKVELEKGRGDSKEEVDLILDENAKVFEMTDWYELSINN